jgi:small subunit ribosomal protein S2
MDIIKNVKENVKEGEEIIEEIGDEITKELKENKKVKKSEKSLGETKEKVKNETDKKRKELLEKAKKLREKLIEKEPKAEELKEKVKGKKKTDMLVPLEEYVKAGIYLGTKAVTPNMKPFVYRRRADGLAIFNTDIIDEKLKEGIEFLSKFNPEDIILVCKREVGWRMARKFEELTKIRVFTKKYPAGILTNINLPEFFENELTIITDQWIDRNALNDTLRVNKKVLMICDTNNFSKGANQIIIGNNKSEKSLGLIFYLLVRGYMKSRGEEISKIPDLEWWTGENKK